MYRLSCFLIVSAFVLCTTLYASAFAADSEIPSWCPAGTTRSDGDDTCYIEVKPEQKESSTWFVFDINDHSHLEHEIHFDSKGEEHGLERSYYYDTKRDLDDCIRQWGRQYCDDAHLVEWTYNHGELQKEVSYSSPGAITGIKQYHPVDHSSAKEGAGMLEEIAYSYNQNPDTVEETYFDGRKSEILHSQSYLNLGMQVTIRDLDIPGSDIHVHCKDGTYLIEGAHYFWGKRTGGTPERLSRVMREILSKAVSPEEKRSEMNLAALEVIAGDSKDTRALVCGRYGEDLGAVFSALLFGRIDAKGTSFRRFDDKGHVIPSSASAKATINSDDRKTVPADRPGGRSSDAATNAPAAATQVF